MLDERIKSRILDDHKKLTADGKLLSKAQLEFVLRDLSLPVRTAELMTPGGEELLDSMHASAPGTAWFTGLSSVCYERPYAWWANPLQFT